MAKITPIQESFAAGEISPKLLGRRSIDGYRSGVSEMTNMIADSRGPAIARDGFKFSARFPGNDGRIYASQAFTTSPRLTLLTDQSLSVVGLFGFLPTVNFVTNPSFNLGGVAWDETTQGNGSNVNFSIGSCEIESGDGGGPTNRFAYIDQQVTVDAPGQHTFIVNTDGANPYRISLGTLEGLGDIYQVITSDQNHEVQITIPGTTCWIRLEQDRNDFADGTGPIVIFDVTLADDIVGITFSTPWLEDELKDIHVIPSPDGTTIYFWPPVSPGAEAGV